jgi:hypothetical protein
LVGRPDNPIDPLLGPLADNGGPTKTHALLPGSPAIDAGDPTSVGGANGVPLFDQRGAPFARIAGGRIDIGAYESQPAAGLFNADFDGDGDIDGRDFLIWQRGYGRTEATPSDGDATVDGRVDRLDLAVWQGTYGDDLSASSAQLSTSQASILESSEPERSMAPWVVTRLDDTEDRAPCYDDVRDAVFSSSEYSEIQDRAFEYWLPARRASLDFGDLVVQRAVRRRVLG